jgi:aminoglycoside 3-N-acetyltransferase
MFTYRDLLSIFRKLDLGDSPVIAHASLKAFEDVQGGAETMVGALATAFSSVIMPTFTYKTMITPETGPPDNGITYGSGRDTNRTAQFFRPGMPADRLIGIVPETLRQHPKAKRSTHPIYSFAGVNAEAVLDTQSLVNPFGPIEALMESRGWVLLLGVDHTVNTSIHYAEQVAGRRQFIRWALTPRGIVECPGWPGCSHGFNQISPRIEESTRKLGGGQAVIQAIPLKTLVKTVGEMIAEDPLALLCYDIGCERCNAVRIMHSKH